MNDGNTPFAYGHYLPFQATGKIPNSKNSPFQIAHDSRREMELGLGMVSNALVDGFPTSVLSSYGSTNLAFILGGSSLEPPPFKTWEDKIAEAANIARSALSKPDCLKLFTLFGKNPSPEVPLAGGGTPLGLLNHIEKKSQIKYAPPSDIQDNLAWAVTRTQWNPGNKYAVRETILVSANFFSDSVKDYRDRMVFKDATAGQIQSLTVEENRALVLLHELLHLYTSNDHSAFNAKEYNDHLLWNCF